MASKKALMIAAAIPLGLIILPKLFGKKAKAAPPGTEVAVPDVSVDWLVSPIVGQMSTVRVWVRNNDQRYLITAQGETRWQGYDYGSVYGGLIKPLTIGPGKIVGTTLDIPVPSFSGYAPGPIMLFIRLSYDGRAKEVSTPVEIVH